MSDAETWLADNGFTLDKWNSTHEWAWIRDDGTVIERAHDGYAFVWCATRGDVSTGWHERPDLALGAMR